MTVTCDANDKIDDKESTAGSERGSPTAVIGNQVQETPNVTDQPSSGFQIGFTNDEGEKNGRDNRSGDNGRDDHPGQTATVTLNEYDLTFFNDLHSRHGGICPPALVPKGYLDDFIRSVVTTILNEERQKLAHIAAIKRNRKKNGRRR